MSKNIEISIDDVEELGQYLEGEYKGDGLKGVSLIREYLHSIVSELGAETEGLDLKGYPFGLMEKRGYLPRL